MPDFRQQVASSILASWPRPSSLSEHRPIPAYLEISRSRLPRRIHNSQVQVCPWEANRRGPASL